MTPAARIAAVIELLDEMLGTERPADTIMSAYFRARKFIGSKDRAAVASHAYRVLRNFLRLNWHLERANAKLTGRNLMLAELLLAEGVAREDVKNVFSGEKYAPEKLREEETYLTSRLLSASQLPSLGARAAVDPENDNSLWEPQDMPLHIKVECPPEYAEKFQSVFGEDFEKEMRGMMTEAPMDLRVNPRVMLRDEALAEIRRERIDVLPCELSPFGIRVAGRPALQTLDIFRRGGVEIQDEGSQLIALLLGAKPGEAVVDFCAGAGGKTLAIAAQMNNKGRVVACDVLDKRLAKARTRFTRAGLDNIQTRPLSSENDKWVKRSAGTFDRVLVDAPCSGTGVWRRNPDARWKQLGPSLDALLSLQESILRSAARLAKPGGTLVYATCSLLPDENQNQVEKFLAAHPDFKLIPVRDAWQNAMGTDAPEALQGEYMALTPARHETDGFFAAIMEKNTK